MKSCGRRPHEPSVLLTLFLLSRLWSFNPHSDSLSWRCNAAQPTVVYLNGTGYSFTSCSSLELGTACWSASAANNSIQMAVTARTQGYIGFGFSPDGRMLGSTAVIGWTGGASGPFVGNYDLHSKDGGNPLSTALQLTETAVAYNSSTHNTTLLFTRPLALPGNVSFASIDLQSSLANNVIIALGNTPISPQRVGEHDRKATAVLMFATAAPTNLSTADTAVYVNGTAYWFPACTSLAFITVCWSVDVVNAAVTLGVSAATSGYLGFGFSADGLMLGSTAVIGWSGGASGSYVGCYDLTSYSGNSPGSTALQISQAAVAYNATTATTTLLFTRPLQLSSSWAFATINLSSATGTSVIASIGATPSSPQTVQQHVQQASGIIDFAAVSSASWLSSSTGASAAAAATAFSSSLSASPCGSSGAAQESVLYVNGTAYSFPSCASAGGFATVCWSVDVVNAAVTLGVSAATSGYLGFGFSADGLMLGSTAVIGWSGGASGSYVGCYDLTSYSGNSPGSTALQISQAAVAYNATTATTTLLFTRPLQLPAAAFASIDLSFGTANSVILAVGSTPTSPQSVQQHTQMVAGVLDFAAVCSGVDGSLAFTIIADNSLLYRRLHAALMASAFGGLFPIAVIIARFCKSFGPVWFQLHRAFAACGVLTATAGFAIAIKELDTGLYSLHRGLGIFVISAVMLQPLTALVRPHAAQPGEQPSPARRMWNVVHHNNARAAIVLGWVNCGIGFTILQPAVGWLLMFCLLSTIIVLTAVLLQVKACARLSAKSFITVESSPSQAAPPLPVIAASLAPNGLPRL